MIEPTLYTYKCKKEYFEEVQSGRKTFEVRLNDAGPFEGDIIVLRELDEFGGLTGREIVRRVGFTFNLSDVEKFYGKKDIERYGINVYSLLKVDSQETCFLTPEGC